MHWGRVESRPKGSEYYQSIDEANYEAVYYNENGEIEEIYEIMREMLRVMLR